MNSWRHHVEGSAQVIQLRGRNQIRTRTGATLFRQLRNDIVCFSDVLASSLTMDQVQNALIQETEVPDYIVQWSQALDLDPYHTPNDQLTVLCARLASIKVAFRTASKSDEELMELGNELEKSFLSWSESTLAAGSVCSFHDVHDVDSPHAWNGTRHEYGLPQAYRYWNKWRCSRILLSRLQETIWRRSWPTLTQPVPDSEHYRSIRDKMAADICVATAYALGNDNSAEPPRGGVSSGHILINPLALTGTCLLEQLAEPIASPGGSRIIFADAPLHTDLLNQKSVQLAWIIERVDYIAQKIGIKWADAVSSFLRGESKIYYDLGRS